MDVATERSGRPHSRPTQAYYVPPRRLQCGLPPNVSQPKKDLAVKERCVTNSRIEVLRDSKTNGSDKSEKKQSRQQRDTIAPPKFRSPNGTSSHVPAPPKSPDVMADVHANKPTVTNQDAPPVPESAPLKSPRTSGFNSSKSPFDTVKLREMGTSQGSATQRTSTIDKSRANAVTRTRSPVFDAAAPVLLAPEKEDVCICDRALAHVYCKSYECRGRVARICAMHPTQLALMDLRECPNSLCRSVQLLELGAINDTKITQ